MHPVLSTLDWDGHARPLGSYGACLALAIMLAACLTLRACVRAGLDAGAIIASLGISVAAGFVGAYACFVGVSWLNGASLHDALTHPGLVFYGGACCAAFAFACSARALSVPALQALDLAAPALPLAHALGRVGCFLGGCCYGAPSSLPWAVTYTHALAPASHMHLARHPWPLYEAACLLLLGLLFWLWPARRTGSGERFAFYVAAYGGLRLLLEPLRGDGVRGLYFHGALSTSQLIAALSLLGALGFIVARGQPLFARTPRRCT